jgi:hypothetical protein
VRLSEEHIRVHLQPHLLTDVVGHARDEHLWVRHARLLRIDALLPQPEELTVVREEAEVGGSLGHAIERERDAADVSVGRYGRLTTRRR